MLCKYMTGLCSVLMHSWNGSIISISVTSCFELTYLRIHNLKELDVNWNEIQLVDLIYGISSSPKRQIISKRCMEQHIVINTNGII